MIFTRFGASKITSVDQVVVGRYRTRLIAQPSGSKNIAIFLIKKIPYSQFIGKS